MHGKSKKKPPNIQEMSKEEIRKTLIKKRETNAQAQRIVESLLESGLTEEIFLSCLPHINQSHLDDVVEERAIAHACGYPLCINELTSKDIPRQQYRISMKTNKVYDITARKNFCSNKCYKAAVYIKEQMLTGPLWFREHEEVPTFHLMPTDAVPSMGKEVDLSIIEKIKVKQDSINFTSVNDFASASFCELDGTVPSQSEIVPIMENEGANSGPIVEQPKAGKVENMEKVSSCQLTQPSTVNIVQQINEKSTNPRDLHNKTSNDKKPVVKDSKNSLNIIGEIIERPENKIDPIIASGVTEENKITKCQTPKKTIPQKKGDNTTAVIIHVEKCIAEWFTLDSIIFLFGEAKVKEMVADKGDFIKQYLNNMASGLMYSSVSYDQYQQLCRKLNMLELEDHRCDTKLISKETKPLPDYSILKEEGKRMELKVKAFLSGDCDVREPSSVNQQAQEDPSGLTQLALVDKNAQNALRRKILLTHLNRVLKDLQQSLGFHGISVASDVRLLVNSFKLKANNIMFKRVQWTLIGVVVLKLLSLRDARIQRALETSQADRNLQLLLLSYKQDGGYLDRLILWLTDIDRLLTTSDTQLTVGQFQ